jgi:hypothetical protein
MLENNELGEMIVKVMQMEIINVVIIWHCKGSWSILSLSSSLLFSFLFSSLFSSLLFVWWWCGVLRSANDVERGEKKQERRRERRSEGEEERNCDGVDAN